MFILRTLKDYESECNTLLGKEYQVIYINHPEFDNLIEENRLRKIKDTVLCLVLDEQRNVHPVFSDSVGNYILTDSGKTFFRFRKSI